MDHSQLTGTIIQAAFRVHTELGPGLLESIYESCLEMDIKDLGHTVKRQVEVPVIYRGRDVGIGFRADLIIDDIVVIELKSVESLQPIHKAQLISYMKLLRLPIGLLVNFNTPHLRDGIRRLTLRN
jgi:GxxExxY protein